MLMMGETVLLNCNVSWRNYWGALFLWTICTLGVALLIVIPVYYFKVNSRRYTITTQRVIAQQGLLAKHIQEVRIVDIRSVNMHQSVWQRLFHVGNILIGTAGTSEVEIRMLGVGHPERIISLINANRMG